MTWTYEQRTGALIDAKGQRQGRGYSGSPDGRDNPEMQHVKCVGPIPQGHWKIHGPFFHPKRGPYCLRLLPMEGTHTFGRSGFLVHGDSALHPGAASEGCIILPRLLRMQLWESGDHELTVVEGASPVVNVA